jgi:uncharacterized protein (DUF697 family)
VARLPLHPSKVLETWREVSGQAETAVSLVLAGEPGLVVRAQERFAAGGTVPAVWTKEAADLLGELLSGEIAVFLVHESGEADLVNAAATAASSLPEARVVLAVDEGDQATGRVSFPAPNCARLSFADTPRGWRRLFEVCLDQAGDRLVALGRRYPVLRGLAARRVVLRAARDNGLVGLAFFVPGADWPVMTLNQLKMVLQLAGLHGYPADSERAVEAAGVVALGLAFRAAARRLRGPNRARNWAIRGAVGYTATLVLGLAAVEYFERGAPASTSRVLAAAASLRR